ncbi:hypothetical protein pmac_cds_382 [Pandoravirus macleodensis]|uniref:DUF5848 domain-containing protein n=1 Tax=Pandoravirus macleodensis TaxID=2107707 RepID=A0A2U7UFI8_9VIRU|nr:hypothetical protein pmac_cds_382 [Pandoravirus macleodensis]AVK77070.1 hypothetical protein pmac_cds_382 [Pandoravirus macleodensis]
MEPEDALVDSGRASDSDLARNNTDGDTEDSAAHHEDTLSPALALATARLRSCAAHGGPATARDRAFLSVLTKEANLLPPGAGRASMACVCDLYLPFWTALQAIEDVHPGTVGLVPWPPTPLSVYLSAADGSTRAAQRRARGEQFGAPYGPERAYALAAASWDALATVINDNNNNNNGSGNNNNNNNDNDGDDMDRRVGAAMCLGDVFYRVVVERADPRIETTLLWEASLTTPAGATVASLVARSDNVAMDNALSLTEKTNHDNNLAEPSLRRTTVARAADMRFDFGGSGARALGPSAVALETVYVRRASRMWPSLVCALLYAALGAVVSDDATLCPLRLLPTGADCAVARADQRGLGIALGSMLAARDL